MAHVVIPAPLQPVTGLGDPVRVYRQGDLSKAGSVVCCVAGAGVALGIAYWGLVAYPGAYPAVARTNVPIIVGAGAALLLGMLFWAWRIHARWSEAAVVYRDGLAHYDGNAVRTFPWHEIEAITMRVVEYRTYGVIKTGTDRRYTIVSQGGDKVKLGNTLSKVEELYNQIRAGVFPHQLARVRAAFDGGQPVAFGPITISRAVGLQVGKKSHAWDEIARILLNEGQVQVKLKKGGPFAGLSVPVERVPNLDVFLALVAEVAKEQAARGL